MQLFHMADAESERGWTVALQVEEGLFTDGLQSISLSLVPRCELRPYLPAAPSSLSYKSSGTDVLFSTRVSL